MIAAARGSYTGAFLADLVTPAARKPRRSGKARTKAAPEKAKAAA